MPQKMVITPPGRFSFPRMSELWDGREVAYRFGARDVTLRYRQTLLGVVWVILQPLLTAAIFTLVFNRVAHFQTGWHGPYMIFAFVGLMGWNLFNGIITRAQQSLVANRDLVSKVFFPRMLVPLAVVYSNLVDLAVSTVFLFLLMAIYGVAPGLALVLAPVWVLMLTLLASGIGVVSAGLTVRYRDVNYFVPFMLQFLLFASPVGYPPLAQYKLLYDVNPLTWLLTEFRWSFLNMPAPPGWQIALSLVVPVVVFVVGSVVFEQMERGFADVI
ncbi:MAG: ABC transporter permease [Acidimicrobiales bacterium]|nr:ABC transporter permease [Acidimicrobiales bacterium]